jgi:hemin uptake protein HemP
MSRRAVAAATGGMNNMWANKVDEKREDGGAAQGSGDAAAPRGSEDVRVIDAQELFAGAREVLIRHNQSTYRLRITRFGKLILNK